MSKVTPGSNLFVFSSLYCSQRHGTQEQLRGRGGEGGQSSVLVQCTQGILRWRCPAVDWIFKSVVRREAGVGGRNLRDIRAGMAGEAVGGEI